MVYSINSTGITVDGIPLNTLAKAVESKTGRMSMVGARGANAVVAGRSGSIWTPGKSNEEGRFVLPMWVLGCDDDGNIPGGSSALKEFYKNKDLLQRIFGKRHALIDVQATQPDGSVRRCMAEVTAVVDFEMLDANDARFNVEFVVPEVYWEDLNATSYTSATGQANNATLTIAGLAGGTAPIEDGQFIVRATTTCTNPQLVDVTTGDYVKYTGSLTAGDDWYVNADTWKSRKGTAIGYNDAGGTNVISATTHGGYVGRLLALRPANDGTQQIKFVTSSGTAQILVQAKRKFYTP